MSFWGGHHRAKEMTSSRSVRYEIGWEGALAFGAKRPPIVLVVVRSPLSWALSAIEVVVSYDVMRCVPAARADRRSRARALAFERTKGVAW